MLPINVMEDLEADKLALELGIVDKQTVSERYVKRYGQDWETIQERITEQQAQGSNLGAVLLQRFNRGE